MKKYRLSKGINKSSGSKNGSLLGCTKLSREQIDDIKIALKQKKHDIVERLSNRFGVDSFSIRQKIGELEVLENLHRISDRMSSKVKMRKAE